MADTVEDELWCAQDCGGGVKERARTVDMEPALGGQPCGELTEVNRPAPRKAHSVNLPLTDREMPDPAVQGRMHGVRMEHV